MEEAVRQRRLLLILYLGFISLGLPDTVLGVAWPEMRAAFQAPRAWAGGLMTMTTVISVGSSLATGWVLRRHHTGRILAVSALMTAVAMLGYGLAPGLPLVAGATVLFGLGQGAVDSAVNAHLARHSSSRQMNWIHGCWGLGATGGPLVFTAAFGLGLTWRGGYLALFSLQLALGLFFLATLGWWRAPVADRPPETRTAPAPETGHSPRRAAAGVAFYFFYPGLEATAGLWGASYLVEVLKAAPTAAGAALAFYWGHLTLGRFAVGLIAGRFSNAALVRGGLALVAAGLILAALASGTGAFTVALALLGLGLSPLYPTMMHETPRRAGPVRGDQVVSFQVGAALAGAAVWPAAVGLIMRRTELDILPGLLALFGLLMIAAHEISARPAMK